MRRLRSPMRCMAAALVASALLVGTAYAATEGPYFKVKEARLGSGETREVLAHLKKEFVFDSKSANVKIACGALHAKSGATIIGSSVKSSGRGSASLEFSECKGGAKEESLSGCEPEKGTIVTEPLNLTLGLAESVSNSTLKHLGVLIQPATGQTFAEAKFVGSGCIESSTTIRGSAIAELPGGEVETVKEAIVFNTPAKTIWTESNGVLTSNKATMSSFGAATTVAGEAEVELVSKTDWGVYMQSD